MHLYIVFSANEDNIQRFISKNQSTFRSRSGNIVKIEIAKHINKFISKLTNADNEYSIIKVTPSLGVPPTNVAFVLE